MNNRITYLWWLSGWVAGAPWVVPAASVAGPNLMAIGNYGSVPYRRAVGRDSFSGKEVIFSFDDPEYDFGRIVVRARQPNSVIRRDLFVGFTGEALVVDARGQRGGGRAVNIEELELWLRIRGEIRPERSYEWELEADAASDVMGNGFPAIIPALWADGEPVGVEVTVRTPTPEDEDGIQRMLLPRGIVKIKPFERQTGGAWVVLKPSRYGSYFQLVRCSFRELDTPETSAANADMPIPVRYVPIRDVLEDDIAEALTRGARALRNARNQDQYWEGSNLEESVDLTSAVVSALAELDPAAEDLMPAMEWLAAQRPDEAQPWSVDTVAARLYCLARHGSLSRFRRAVLSDIQFLISARFDDGGWTSQTRSDQPKESAVVRSDNPSSAVVLRSLREARFAGVEIDKRNWRRIMRYWTDAQAYDGGFRQTLERYGGLGRATTSAYTSLGAAALITSLDMAAGFGGRRCNTFRASRKQLRAIDAALAWLDEHYQERFSSRLSLGTRTDPYAEPFALQWLGEVSGLTHFNDKNHFAESARELLTHYDKETGMFGRRADDDSWAEPPSLLRTAVALSVLGAGAAPPVCQRIIAGDDERGWTQYKGDVAHLVRYLAAQRGRPFNWRRTTIDRPVRELVEVPILFLSVVGPFDWSPEEWGKIREYCFAGGTVVIDIAEGQKELRGVLVRALEETFPEYELRDLPPDSPIFSIETKLSEPPGIEAIGNGFRDFLFLPAESWSCLWHLYRVDDHEDSFAFMNNLLTYVTDGTPLRSSFAPSTYAVGSIPAHSMKMAHLEVGSEVPAFPNLVETLDRLMQANFRLRVSRAGDPKEADILWVSITGDKPLSEADRARIVDVMENGRFLFADIVGGREDPDETFRTTLSALEGVTLEKLRRTDPIFTGKIPGTQGFDVVETDLRKALHTRFSTKGRCDLYGIRWKGEAVGVYSTYDVSSGIGYHYYPGCRGVMPWDARKMAMNACLMAYARKVSRRSPGQVTAER